MTVRTSLGWRLLTYRRRRFGALAALCGAVVAAVAVTTGWSTSSDLAQQESVTARVAGYPYVVSTLDPRANATLAAVPGSISITELPGQVATSSRIANATILAVSGGVVPRVIAEGRGPSVPAEAVVAQTTAQDLGIEVGASVWIRGADGERVVTVTGIVVDPGNRWDDAVILPAGGPSSARVTRWLMVSNPASLPSTRLLLEQGAIDVSSLTADLEDLRDPTARRPAGFLPYAVPVLITIGGLLLVMTANNLSPILRHDHDALRAAGMTRDRSSRTVLTAVTVAVVLGLISGSALGQGFVVLLRDQLSASIDQIWLTVAGAPVLLVTLAMAVLAVVLSSGALALTPIRSRIVRPVVVSTVGLIALGVLLAIFVVLNLQFAIGRAVLPYQLGLPVAILLAAGSGWAVRAGLARSRGALRSTLAAMGGGPVALGAAVGVIAVLATFFSGTQANNTFQNLEFYSRQQPLGSLVVEGLSPEATAQLRQAYNERGGRQTRVWQQFDESRRVVRATSSGAIACLESRGSYDIEDGSECLTNPNAYTTLGPLVLDTQDRSAPLRVAGDLLRDGQVGLLIFPGRTDRAAGRKPTAQLQPAIADQLLGGVMPAASIGLDNPLVAQLGLRSSGSQVTALLDFGTLSRADQAYVRARVANLAPAGRASELLVPQDLNVRRLGLVVALCAAALAVGLVLTTLTALWSGRRETWSILRVLADRRHRSRMVLWWSLPLITAAVAGAALGAWLMWFANPHNGMGFGWEWALPGGASVLATAVMVNRLQRRLTVDR